MKNTPQTVDPVDDARQHLLQLRWDMGLLRSSVQKLSDRLDAVSEVEANLTINVRPNKTPD